MSTSSAGAAGAAGGVEWAVPWLSRVSRVPRVPPASPAAATGVSGVADRAETDAAGALPAFSGWRGAGANRPVIGGGGLYDSAARFCLASLGASAAFSAASLLSRSRAARRVASPRRDRRAGRHLKRVLGLGSRKGISLIIR